MTYRAVVGNVNRFHYLEYEEKTRAERKQQTRIQAFHVDEF